MALSSSQKLDQVLDKSFSNPETLVLGFAVSGDLAKLAASYPCIKAFRSVKSVLDVQQLARSYFVHTSPEVMVRC